MISSTFTDNSSGSDGGGIYTSGRADISTSSIQANVSHGNGGGASFGSSVTMTGTRFISNTATGQGGATFLFLGISIANNITNSLFAHNRSASNQGHEVAIFANNGTAYTNFVYNTLANSTPISGSAIYIRDSVFGMTNTLMTNQNIAIMRIGGTVKEDYNVFANVTTPYSGTLTTGGHSITGTVNFADAALDNFHLLSGSAGINAATNLGVNSDFDSQPRPQGGGYDIGFTESAYSPTLSAANNGATLLGNPTILTATLQNGANFTVTWDFGDGTPQATGSLTITHIYTTAGSFTATVTANNLVSNLTASTQVQINAPAQPTATPTQTATATAIATATTTPSPTTTSLSTPTPTATATATATTTPMPTTLPTATSAPSSTPTTSSFVYLPVASR